MALLVSMFVSAPARAVEDLRMTISPESGREGLYPVLTSVDPCPVAPGGAGVEIRLTWDQDPDWSNGTLGYGPHSTPLTWQAVAVKAVMKRGTVNKFRATCGYRDADGNFQSLATYAPVTFTSTDEAAHVKVSRTTLPFHGSLDVASSAVGCPTGGELVSVAAYGDGDNQDYVLNPPFESAPDGSFSAKVDFTTVAPGIYWLDVKCFEYVQTNPQHAQLEYAWEKITVSEQGKQRQYVAMGDSYSSGEGARPFDKPTASNDYVVGLSAGRLVNRFIDACHRSDYAWPRYISRATSAGSARRSSDRRL
jgi:hypothetical protein